MIEPKHVAAFAAPIESHFKCLRVNERARIVAPMSFFFLYLAYL